MMTVYNQSTYLFLQSKRIFHQESLGFHCIQLHILRRWNFLGITVDFANYGPKIYSSVKEKNRGPWSKIEKGTGATVFKM